MPHWAPHGSEGFKVTCNLGDPRFFARSGPHSLASVVAAAEGSAPEQELMLSGVAALHSARHDQVSFLDNRRYLPALEHTHAGAVLVHPDLADHVPKGVVPILTTSVYGAWARVAALFHPLPLRECGIHPMAAVDPTATIHPTALIGAFVSVGAHAEIGAHCRIAAGAVLGDGVTLGPDCRVGAQASISHARIGARVYICPGARIGQEGFSFAKTAKGFLSIPHLGQVIIEDDVEIGANSTVDRGSSRDTIIGAGTRVDNLVQIGHNVELGRHCVVVAQVGISGSTTVEDFVQIGGQVGIAGHLTIGTGAQIGAQSGVIADVPAQARLLGSPAQPASMFFRQVATLKRLVGKRG
ncbi:UDP-3-O-(3-hydroxymyristoyl)glucosamine N-acyltransferase [Roseococcus sp. SYP-B2431]|uniref:UDP-3-O-(3-hydroxymyristoyl)glucosamine N-acyltransferase n=1 Tax=Roseococcus sp. SYP-B2431 TaxID=2496640 RepID=UPI00103FF1D3|nr:UDP-3-O-(3-hydroxymyristoyl)glucosamine N-acyltransferase [Roseococcus sp. SYP-B2431]TCH98769.1 UDP-3-O-(3-hydroxymyristoyl)glucosamine N-acyltransferase [Roseococcus sp. SYP-B2431]